MKQKMEHKLRFSSVNQKRLTKFNKVQEETNDVKRCKKE
jgi:hypothetical protein